MRHQSLLAFSRAFRQFGDLLYAGIDGERFLNEVDPLSQLLVLDEDVVACA